MGTTSCEDWLDVNIDEDSPNSSSATVETRLPWIQRWNNYSFGILNFRTSCSAGVFYSKNSNYNTASVTWNMAAGITTTFYQCWFTSVGNNLNDFYNAAEAAGATHYMAMANIFHAMGSEFFFINRIQITGRNNYVRIHVVAVANTFSCEFHNHTS